MRARNYKQSIKRSKSRRRGVTAVEVLFMIALAGFAICLFVISVQSAKANSRENTCATNLRKLALAMHNFESGNRKFPSQATFAGKAPEYVTVKHVPGKTSGGDKVEASYSFIVWLLPQYDEQTMFESIDYDLNPFTPVNGKFSTKAIPSLQCPSFTVGGK